MTTVHVHLGERSYDIHLGGGPAGLTAGYVLAKQGRPVIVLESTDQVGGIARTEVRDGYRFDLGGHRFCTKASSGRTAHSGGRTQSPRRGASARQPGCSIC